jgi:hypothetical protein
VIEWRGPAPFFFIATPPDITDQIEEVKGSLTYGWGVIPAKVTINKISVTTSLIPKNGSFYVPLKETIRKPNQIEVGDLVKLTLEL